MKVLVNSCNASTLQTIINNANNGDIINIARGTHTFTSTVTINKSLTISGGGVYATSGDPPAEAGTWPVEQRLPPPTDETLPVTPQEVEEDLGAGGGEGLPRVAPVERREQ